MVERIGVLEKALKERSEIERRQRVLAKAEFLLPKLWQSTLSFLKRSDTTETDGNGWLGQEIFVPIPYKGQEVGLNIVYCVRKEGKKIDEEYINFAIDRKHLASIRRYEGKNKSIVMDDFSRKVHGLPPVNPQDIIDFLGIMVALGKRA